MSISWRMAREENPREVSDCILSGLDGWYLVALMKNILSINKSRQFTGASTVFPEICIPTANDNVM